MTGRIRLARPQDVDAVATIEEEAFSFPWPRSAFVKELANDLAVFKVIEDEDGIAGYYDLWVYAEEAHLLNIAVARAKRGRGYGERLARDALAAARRRRAATMYLEVRRDNAAAKALYLKIGFSPVRVRRRYYEDGQDAEVMALTL